MKVSANVGKAFLLACSALSLSACDRAGSSTNAGAETSGLTASESAQEQIRQAIADAPKHGLKPDLFLKGGESGDQLVRAALTYANALANGYSDPEKLFEVYTIDRQKTDVRAGLQQAFEAGNVGDYLNSLAPQTDEYRALGEAFLRYVKLAGDQREESIDTSKAIKPGAQDPRIPKIESFLRAAGYLSGGAPAAEGSEAQRPSSGGEGQQSGEQAGAVNANTAYTPELVQAVKAYQADSGLKTDGILGGNTLDALNNGSVVRARQLAVAMERLRWLQRDPPKTRIDVNTAATTLAYYRDGQLVGQRKVVAGEADAPTPQLQSPIYRLVANPTWTVPKGIAEKELASKSSAWLQQNDFVIKDGMYVQQSGPKSALGEVKFDMQNDMAIYLHDTPAKALFSQDERHRSHGCVRVEDAVGFANMLAQQEGIADKFGKAMAQDEQSFVNLPKEIPVRLLYRTAFWDGSRVRFARDLYGWDANVAKALGLAPGRPERIEQPESSDDIGP
ncbi:MAG TPA: L,D-transpeptidase family protein [Sphingomicrobium sp.]